MKKTFILCVLIFNYQLIFTQQLVKVKEGIEVNDKGGSRSVNWIDYDVDGDLDLFVSNGPKGGQNNFFYENNGDGTFRKITGIEITMDKGPSDGSTWGDYDNDGYPDLFVVNWYGQNNLLYHNNGDKTFRLVSESVISNDHGSSETGSWGDFNNDGFLDLYVCNSGSENLKNFLYKNNGDGTFEKINFGQQVNDEYISRNVDWIDINNDGFQDLFITNEDDQNENLYINKKDGTFKSINDYAFLKNLGKTTSSSWGDIDNDGDFDLFLANYGNQHNSLFLNNGNGSFTNVVNSIIAKDISNSFSSSFGDIDNDGDLDLVVTNAYTRPNKTLNFLYINKGNGTFIKDTITFANDSGWTYGCAFGDYNNDGFLDLFIARNFDEKENNVLYKNVGNSNNWVELDLVGTKSNKSAIGAIVKIKTKIFGKEIEQIRRVTGQTGYCGQNLRLHFGLGNSDTIELLKIFWPSGGIQEIKNLNVNKLIKIKEKN